MASRCFGFVASLLVSSSIFLGQLPAIANSQQALSPLSTTNTSATAQVLAQVVPNFGVVTPFILRGAQPSRQGFEALKAAGVRTVINLRDGKKDIANEKELVESLGMKSVSIPLSVFKTVKDEDIEKFLKVVNDPNNGPVFMHCRQGQDRCGTMVAIYRLTKQSWGAAQAYDEMLKYGFHPFFIGLSNSMYRVAANLGRPETPPSANEIFTDLKSRLKQAIGTL
ncbi:MAG: tyrosine-protein phosphatase [Candidatus Obscuribacterales bacterium]|nr:tyrosine-protein phosphatase [Candidatus Obscuribacterales bacterium]